MHMAVVVVVDHARISLLAPRHVHHLTLFGDHHPIRIATITIHT